MPRGGRRAGAGRHTGSGRFGEPTVPIRVPESMLADFNDQLLGHLAAKAAAQAKTPIELERRAFDISVPCSIHAGEAIDVLRALFHTNVRAAAVVLDPWYRACSARGRSEALREAVQLIHAAARVADHIFFWGWPESVGPLVDFSPTGWKLERWLTWTYTNAPSRAVGWRPAQQACLHFRRHRAPVYPSNFFTDDQRARKASGGLMFCPGPPSVINHPLIVGWCGKNESVGFKGQKPVAVIEQLLKMVTKPGSLVIDPTCGSGTTGVAAMGLGCRVILSDRECKARELAARRMLIAYPTCSD